ncbi:hypothetical protein L917_17701, partial [Phytophthora nicotianae]
MLLAEMKRKIGTMVNDRVPDVTQLFAKELKMDLAEVDVEARIAKYFMSFDQLVEENGLTSILGRGPAQDEGGRQRMKLRCKLLLNHVMPEMLKVDLTRLVEMTHRRAKIDDLVLHDLIVERATQQQQYHLMQSEMKQISAQRPRDTSGTPSGVRQRSKPAAQVKPVVAAAGTKKVTGPQKPPRDGCLVCKGPHWARDCPTATPEQKADVERTLQDRRTRRQEKVKRVTANEEPAFRTTVVNGVLDVPFCPDTGSDANIIGRPVLNELQELMELRVELVQPPVEVVVAGGNRMQCHEKVHVDLQIVTAAGPLQLTNIECLVLEAPEEELLLGKTTLQSIGVDLDGIFEQLAQQRLEDAEAEADDVPGDDVEVLGTATDDEVEQVLHRLVDDAVDEGFDEALADDLRTLVLDYEDIFRLRLGRDEPADVQPLEVCLEPEAQPYRSG